jgi:hypothetical protein
VGTRDRDCAGLALIVALAAGVTSGPAFADSPKVCPPDIYPDGLGCVHPRATCGGWDGLSCTPSATATPESDRLAAIEFTSVDADSRKVCPEDAGASQVYSGNAVEVTRAVDADLGRAVQIDKRLAQLRDALPAPKWQVATFARTAAL